MEMRENRILHNTFHLMRAHIFVLGQPVSRSFLRPSITRSGVLERLLGAAAAETDTSPWCGAGFSHRYHMALQF